MMEERSEGRQEEDRKHVPLPDRLRIGRNYLECCVSKECLHKEKNENLKVGSRTSHGVWSIDLGH